MKLKPSASLSPDDCRCRHLTPQLLVLIGEQELLPTLFGQIVIPEAVFRELQATATPPAVQKWLAQGPDLA